MPIAQRTRGDLGRNDAGTLLIGVGAILLLVSLFLEWYQPGIGAWSAFEVWDLVLALAAIGALVAVAGRLGFGPPRPSGWLLSASIAALVIVLYAILDPPPVITGSADGDPSTGLWLALAAALLMAGGAMLSVARISIAITTHPAASESAAGPQHEDPAVPGHGRPVAGADATAPTPPTEPTRPL